MLKLNQVASGSVGSSLRRLPIGEYARRREKLVERIRSTAQQGDVVVVLKGAQRSYIAPDVPHAYRQCSHFRYVTGVTQPGCWFVMHVPERGPESTVLFADRRSQYEELWEGKLADESELVESSGCGDVRPTKELETVLDQMIGKGKATAVFDADSMSGDANLVMRRAASMQPVKNHIDALRVVKSAAELDLMRQTCSIGARAMGAMIGNARGVTAENELVGRLELEARRRGAAMLAYPPVVAAGNRANTIHYLDANQHISDGDSLLVDAGCDVDGYVSDITRCFPIGGEWSESQRIMYEALDAVHGALLETAAEERPLRLSSLYASMIHLIGHAMTEAGVLPKGLRDKELITAAEELCPHHVSHYLGMDVHDCATVSRNRDIGEGVVFTIEPGVYVPYGHPLVPRQFHGIGFRIEDDVAVTSTGIEVLTAEVPRDAHAIEQIMGQYN